MCLLGFISIGVGTVGWFFQANQDYRDQIVITPSGGVRDESFTAVVSSSAAQKSNSITVAVQGAVKKPGMYSLPLGSRVGEAIAVAGGFSDQATPSSSKELNLATILKDGEQIWVPTGESKTAENTTSTSKPTATPTVEGISINTASIAELDALPGIGQARAEAIIAGRPYTSLQELVAQKILSQTVFDSIKELIIL